MPNACRVFSLGFFLLLGASGFSASTNALFRPGFKVWETRDGLPQNSVITMTQTRDGYLWLGTLKGLVRFDGLHFTIFDESNTPGLNSIRIIKLFEDSQGHLWIGTETAGTKLMQAGQLSSPPELESSGAERRLMAACEDSTGAVWLYLANGDLWQHQGGKFTRHSFAVEGRQVRYRVVIPEAPGTVLAGTAYYFFGSELRRVQASSRQTNIVENITAPASLDYLLASKRGGYWRLADGSIQRWQTTNVVQDLGQYPWTSPVAVACEDREGNLVVGTRGGGLYWFDAQGKATRFSTTNGLSNDYILSLLVDKEGTLWVGTDGGGLNRVTSRSFGVVTESQGRVVQSVAENAEGGIWIGYNNELLDFWKEGKVQFTGRIQSIGSTRAVFVDRNQQVWAGAFGSGLFLLASTNFYRVSDIPVKNWGISAIHQDRAGRLWLGSQAGLLVLENGKWRAFTQQDGLSSEAVRAIAEDKEGNLWIGTVGGGLNRLRDGKFTAFKNKQDGVASENISSLYVDGDGVLWVGTDGGGLARMQNGKWTSYTTAKGLISNSVGYLLEDGEGYLWMGSTLGLMRVLKKDLNDFAKGLIGSVPCRRFGEGDGLPTSECTFGSQPGACRTRDGKLWFPTIKGLVSVDPAGLVPNTNPPPVVFESVLIDSEPQTLNGQRVSAVPSVTVPAGKERRLEIHYTSLNLAAAEQARFKYRIEGHETNWTEVGNTRVAYYSSKLLPAGRYEFHVTACNEDGVWNERGSSLGLIIEPPYWKTWWFRTATAVGALALVVGAVYYFATQKLQRQLLVLKQQESLEKERSRIARDIHDQLGASLTQVALLGELVEGDKDSPTDVASHAKQITQTSQDISRVLDEIVWTVNPQNDTLEGLVNYVCKYAQDYLNVAEIRYRLDVPTELPAANISPEVRHNVFLAAKEALTNVVRHAKATAVSLRLKLTADSFVLEIEDNGKGLAGMDAQRAATRNGLRNQRKRMEDIGGQFAMDPGTEAGVRVRLTVPLEGAKKS